MTGTGFGDGSPSIGRGYTSDGLIGAVISNGSTWTFGYNNHRLLTTEQLVYYTVNWTATHGFDANAHENRLKYPDGAIVTFAPDALGEPTQVSGYASAVTYQPNGAVAGYTLANGIVHTLTQNTRGLTLQNIDTGILNDQYAYDPDGDVTEITDLQSGISTRSMSYDGLQRLTVANSPNVWGSGSYTYDPIDNIRTSIVGSRSSTHNYNTSNLLSSVVSNGVTTAYGHDSQGNITARGAQGFTFDQANRMTSATGLESYAYDGLGRRTGMTGASGTYHMQFYRLGGSLLFGSQQSGATSSTTRYVYLGGKEIAETNTSSGTTFIHTDALGSPVASTTGVAATVSYSCSSGGTLSGNTCITTSSSAATPVYACPAGYTLSGTTCQGTSTTAASFSWSCNGHGSLTPYAASASGYKCMQVTELTKLPDPLGRCEALSGGLPLVATTSTATVLTCVFGPVKVYSCPTGATLSGTNCITPVAQAASISGYTCASGTLSGSTCVTTITAAATANYSCPGGGTLSGASCIVVSRTRYEPYGNTAAGTPPTWIGFTGHVNDADTGLIYMQQRYYDPIAARFMSIDPIATDANTGSAFNRYTYVDNDPLDGTDPTGSCTGSHIENNDGTCASTGGNTTGTNGALEGAQYARAVEQLGQQAAAISPVAAAVAGVIVKDLQKHLDSIEEVNAKLAHWQAIGVAGEAVAESELREQGWNIRATHLIVSTALGLRITDLVANGGPNGRSDTGFEVKVNKSPYTLKQQMKDASIATKGGTVQSRTSANFPYGSRVQYPTGVIFVFDEIE